MKQDSNLASSIKEGLCMAVTTGLTSSFITPFAITLGATSGVIALLSSVPELIGSFFELSATKLVRFFNSRRNLLVGLTILQTFAMLSLSLLAFAADFFRDTISNILFALLIGVIIFNSSSAHLKLPIWNSYMGDLVDENSRGKFFGKRNRGIALTTFVTTLIAGSILNSFHQSSVYGFVIIFALAMAASILSAYFKFEMANIPYTPKQELHFNVFDLMYNLNKTPFGAFILYNSTIKFAVNIANPFFALYMLKVLQFDYVTFTVIVAAPIIANFITLKYWGPIIDKHGTKWVLQKTGICIFLIPLLWLVNQSPVFIFCIEAFSGAVWAGYNLAASNYLLDAVKPANRVRCVAWHNCFMGVGIFFGAILGGLTFEYIPALWVWNGFQVVLIFSVIARIIPTLLLLPRLKEMRFLEIGFRSSSFFGDSLVIQPSPQCDYPIYSAQKEKKPVPKILDRPKSDRVPKDYKHSLTYKNALISSTLRYK